MSATPAQIQAVYDFENIIPAGIVASAALSTANLNLATQATISKLEKPRPRTECILRVGGETNPRQIYPVQSFQLNMAWNGTLSFLVLTDGTESAKVLHGQMVSQVRFLLPQIGAYTNGITLTNHKVQFVRETGTTMMIKSEEGYFSTSISYEVTFSIQSQALQALNT